MMRHLLRILSLGLVVFATSCVDESPTSFSADGLLPDWLIQDALHDMGNPFVFLKPPVVEEPDPSLFGTFNPDLQPIVELCQLNVPDPGDCQILQTNDGSNQDARYTMDGGPGGDAVRMDPVAEEYQVQIQFRLYNLSEGETYRIITRVGSKELAFADVVVARGPDRRNVDGDASFVLRSTNRTLPWKVRIDQGALCWEPDQAVLGCTSTTAEAGEEATVSLMTEDGDEVDLFLPSGWTPTVGGEPVEDLTLTIQEVPAVFGTGGDPSCFQFYELGDPQTGEPENCFHVRADTDSQTDVAVSFSGPLPILAFCPGPEVLQSIANGLLGWIMSSVKQDLAGTIVQTYENVMPPPGFGGCTLPPPVVAFGGGAFGRFASALWQWVRPVVRPFLATPLYAYDIGFGGEIEDLDTVFFWSRLPVDLEVAPDSPSLAVGASVPLFVQPVFHDEAPTGSAFDVHWSSSNVAIATVDANGEVTGVATGTADISATAVNLLDPSAAPVDGSTTVTVLAAPDLVVQSLTHSPSPPSSSDVIDLTAVVENQGSGAAGPSALLLFLNSFEAPGSGDTSQPVPALNPGDTYEVQRQVVFPGIVPPPGVLLQSVAVADHLSAVAESDESNNGTFELIQVLPPPDLVVSSMTHAPPLPSVLDEITFTATVLNDGLGPSRPSTLMFKIGGETPGLAATLFAIPSLNPGQSFVVMRQETLGVAQGYTNTATADWDAEVGELDETNNTSTHNYSVMEPPVE